MVHGGRMRDSGHTWNQEVNIRRTFFIMRVKQWNRLPREVLQFPFLKVFKDWKRPV